MTGMTRKQDAKGRKHYSFILHPSSFILPPLLAILLTACSSREVPKSRAEMPMSTKVKVAIAAFQDGSVERIRRSGVLRVGADDTTGPPFMYWDTRPSKAEISGFEVQIAQRMARSLGVNLRILATPWSKLRSDLRADRFDLIINGQEVPADRSKHGDLFFSHPYYLTSQAIVVRADDQKVHQLQDLARRRVGVLEAGVGNAVLEELNELKGTGIAVRVYRRADALLADLQGHNVDAALLDTPLASWHLRGRGRLKAVGYPILPRPFSVVGRSRDAQLQAAVNAVLQQADKIRPLLQHWSLWNAIQPGYVATK